MKKKMVIYLIFLRKTVKFGIFNVKQNLKVCMTTKYFILKFELCRDNF